MEEASWHANQYVENESGMHVLVFMALISCLVLVRQVLVVFSTLLYSRVEESLVLRHVKPPRSGEASRKPRALSWSEPKPLVH